MAGMRLQKFLAAAGVCSRRAAEREILAGAVRVNSQLVTQLGQQIDPEVDQVFYRDRRVTLAPRYRVILLHKPAGVVTSCRHTGQPTVIELVKVPDRLFPVGRLDRESTGLLIMTNYGLLHQHLSHPSFDHEKEYEVSVDRPISDQDLATLRAGMFLADLQVVTRPAQVTRISAQRFRIVLQEGRNRQIRRMARQLHHRVTALKRIRMATLRLGDLPEGCWRELTPQEIRALEAACGLLTSKPA